LITVCTECGNSDLKYRVIKTHFDDSLNRYVTKDGRIWDEKEPNRFFQCRWCDARFELKFKYDK